VPKVARVGCGLRPDVPKLKSRASGLPGLVKAIPQHPVGEGLAVLVLNEPGALDLRRPGDDALDHLGKIPGDLDSQLLAGFVLLHVQCAVPDVGAGQLEYVGRPLASQQGQVHGVLQGVMPFLPDRFEFVVFDVAITSGFLVPLDAGAGVRGVGIAPFPRPVENVGKQGAFPVGANLGSLAAQIQVGAHVLGPDSVNGHSAEDFQQLGEFGQVVPLGADGFSGDDFPFVALGDDGEGLVVRA